MQCERARELLGAYGDGELPPEDRNAVAGHLESCPACRDALADYKRLGRALALGGRLPVPPGLNARIKTALNAVDAEAEAASPEGQPARTSGQPWLSQRRTRSFLTQAASVLVACAISAAGAWWLANRVQDADRLERDLFNAHIRSLLQESPVQVASSEQHTLRPWFAGRTDVAPPVKSLDVEGFDLIGGRLDYVDGRRATVLVYKRRLHVINVFMWPAVAAGGDTHPEVVTRNGYNMLSLRHGGITIWLVSDLSADELRQLAERL
jgi:anti-sigma factor RsiW